MPPPPDFEFYTGNLVILKNNFRAIQNTQTQPMKSEEDKIGSPIKIYLSICL